MGKKGQGRSVTDIYKMSDNYIFYNRLNVANTPQSGMWKRVYRSAMSDFNNNVRFFNNITYEDISKSLIRQGYVELEKEQNLLYLAFGIPKKKIRIQDYPKYISEINKFIGLKDDYANLVQLINQGRKDKKGRTHKDKERAYSVMAFFDGYFTPVLRQKMDNFMRTSTAEQILLTGNDMAWEREMRRIIESSISETIQKLSQQKDIIGDKEVQVWQKTALKLLTMTEKQTKQLKSDIFKRYNMDKVIKELWTWEKEKFKQGNKSQKGLSTKIKKSYNISEKKNRSISGFLDEYASSLAGEGIITENGTTITRGVLKSNIAKTDSITIFSTSGRINLDNIFEMINSDLKKSSSLVEAEKIIENFNNYLKALKDTFVIYESSKAYSLGKNFRGFNSISSKPLSSLPSYLDRMGSKINGVELVQTLYNTIPGTIGAAQEGRVKENISLAMSEIMANFMFDDWKSIGVSTNNSIHMFKLDEIQIPLSYLLIGAGTAMQQISAIPTSFFKVSFSLPKEILYPIKVGEEDGSFSMEKGMEGYWDEQRQVVETSAKFSVRFLSNFRNLIKDLVKTV